MVPGAGRLQNERRTWWQILRVAGGLALLAWRRVDFPIEALVAEAGDSADNPIAVAIETGRGLWVAALRETGRLRRLLARHDTAMRGTVFSHSGQRCARASAHRASASLIKRAAERVSTSRSLASSAIAVRSSMSSARSLDVPSPSGAFTHRPGVPS
jgi:hypothetical protein